MTLYAFNVRLFEIRPPQAPGSPPSLTVAQHLEVLRQGGADYAAAKARASAPKGK
jgi:hypothetical protein